MDIDIPDTLPTAHAWRPVSISFVDPQSHSDHLVCNRRCCVARGANTNICVCFALRSFDGVYAVGRYIVDFINNYRIAANLISARLVSFGDKIVFDVKWWVSYRVIVSPIHQIVNILSQSKILYTDNRFLITLIAKCTEK